MSGSGLCSMESGLRNMCIEMQHSAGLWRLENKRARYKVFLRALRSKTAQRSSADATCTYFNLKEIEPLLSDKEETRGALLSICIRCFRRNICLINHLRMTAIHWTRNSTMNCCTSSDWKKQKTAEKKSSGDSRWARGMKALCSRTRATQLKVVAD